MTLPLDAYPDYARSERIADGTLHALGVAFALAGATVLLGWAARDVDAGQMTALVIYGVALVATFTASALYHMTPWERLRPTLRRIDHAAIYLKIAGTFTPLAVMIGTPFAYGVLTLVWAMAIWGMTHKLFFWRVPGRYGPALYLAMGWLGVLLIPAIAGLLPSRALALLGAGGLLYTAGVIFFSWDSLKFANAIWHAFVLAASVCFFIGICMATAAAGSP